MRIFYFFVLLSFFFLACKKQVLVKIGPFPFKDSIGKITLSDSAIVLDQYTVTNEGVSGNTTTDLLARMNDVYKNKPDLVILLIGTNDSRLKVPPNTYQTHLDSIVSNIKAHGSQILLISPPPSGTNGNDVQNQQIDNFVNVVASVAKSYNCFYFDLNAAFKAHDTPNPTASSLIRNSQSYPENPDEVHPTPYGYLLITDELFKFMISHNLTNYGSICCFGDSITRHGGYPEALQALLDGLKDDK